MTLSEFDYFCSSAIAEPDNFLKNKIFVTSELSCVSSWKSHITMQIFVASIFVLYVLPQMLTIIAN